MLKQIVPLIIVILLVVVLLAWALAYSRSRKNVEREEKLRAEERWERVCQFDNPETGAKCQREEFHLNIHYHDLGNGKVSIW